MRPLRLELSGFSAFRDTTVIDFRGLDVVALVGPTGAGKSSIIDALTFALYGSVARYGEKDVAPVVNQLSSEARVRFDFEVDRRQYSVARIVRRTKTGATTREARLEHGDEILAGDAKSVTAAVESLLGLTFERFNKTVVLPQGRFAEFLHDKPSQRQELLRELLGLGIYEQVGQLARLRNREAAGKADVLRRQLDDGRDLSDAAHELLARRVKSIAAARADVALIAADRAELAAAALGVRSALADAESTVELLRSVTVPSGVSELGQAIAAAVAEVAHCEQVLDTARQSRRDADAAASAGPSIAACEAVLDRYRRYHEVIDRSTSALAELGQASEAFAEIHEAVEVLDQRIAVLRQQASEARERHRRSAEELEAGGEHGDLLGLLSLHEQRSTAVADLAAAAAAVAEAERLAETAGAHHAAAHETLHHLQELAPAAALVPLLHLGEACPVCEQVVQTLPKRRVDDGRLADARRAASAADAELGVAQQARSTAIGSASAIRQHLRQLDARLDGAPPAERAKELLAALVDLRAAEREAARLQAEAESALHAAESSEATKRLRERERQADRRLAAASAGADHLRGELQAVTASLDGAADEVAVAEDLRLATTLAEARERATRDETAAETAAKRAADALAGLSARESQARRSFAAARDVVTALGPPAASDDIAADWLGLGRWATETAASAQASADVLRGEHEQLRRTDRQLLDEMSEIAAPYLGISTGRDAASTTGASTTAPTATMQERLAAAEAAAVSELDRFEDDLRRTTQLRRELDGYESQAQVAGLLGDLLRSTKFERWLLDEAVTDLVDRATVRLRELTGGQYSLIAQDGGFRICDHRNADEVRDARSLSGGETFLASLALALALADSATDLAAEGTAPLESIFLDEGFGTLDPDTLDVVAGTIEELGAAGRMVAIVTHIRELAERMPVRFEVAKGSTTSTVTRVEL